MLDQLILSNLKQQQTKKGNAQMNNIITAIQHYSNIMTTTNLQNELKRVDSLTNEVYKTVDSFFEEHLNDRLEDCIPYGFSFEASVEFTFTTQGEFGLVALSTDELCKDLTEQKIIINPRSFNFVFPSEDVFDLSISFEIKDHRKSSTDTSYFYGWTRTKSYSFDDFVSKLSKITHEQLIESLDLSNILNEENLENTVDLFVQQSYEN